MLSSGAVVEVVVGAELETATVLGEPGTEVLVDAVFANQHPESTTAGMTVAASRVMAHLRLAPRVCRLMRLLSERRLGPRLYGMLVASTDVPLSLIHISEPTRPY